MNDIGVMTALIRASRAGVRTHPLLGPTAHQMWL